MMNWWGSFITHKEGVCFYERGEMLMSARAKTGWGMKGFSSHLKGETPPQQHPWDSSHSSHFVPLLSSCQSYSNVISRLYTSLTFNSWLQIFMYLTLTFTPPKLILHLHRFVLCHLQPYLCTKKVSTLSYKFENQDLSPPTPVSLPSVSRNRRR